MKRFYKEVDVAPSGGSFGVRLDGRAVRTPARGALEAPSAELARAMADEWRAQGEQVDPRTMPLTGLANAAIDRIAPDPAAFARGLAAYGETDLVCYRAQQPERLVARQAERWDPFISWARARYDIELKVVRGIIHQAQPALTVNRLGCAVAVRSPFALAGMAPLVTVSGSLIIALAVAEGAFGTEQAWAAAALDEEWQAEQWGEDAEAAAALASRRRDFEAGARFLGLIGRV